MKNGSLDWKGSLNQRAKRLLENLEKIDPDVFQQAVQREITSRIQAFADGVNKFQHAARSSTQTQLPTIWSEGTTTLLHAEAIGAPVILVPSLVNRAYILDLNARRSLLRYLAAHGLDTYLVDWDAPGEAEMSFNMDDYVDRLERIRDHVIARTGQKPTIVGYCMGGNLALALAHRSPDDISKLALLATPWDFHAMPAAPTVLLKASMPGIRQLVALMGALPVDVLQAMFSGLDPGGTVQKFRTFASYANDSKKAREFIELEDWLNDGVPLVAKVALECLEDWYVDNKTMHGNWLNGGKVVDPCLINLPALVIIPERDTIVPPASAAPLATQMPQAELLRLNAGHIGMVAGSKAKAMLYEPLKNWICAVQ